MTELSEWILTLFQGAPLQFIYGVQLFWASLLNLFFLKKRKGFVPRFILCSIAIIALAYFVPDIYLGNVVFVNFFVIVTGLLVMYAVTTESGINTLVYCLVVDVLLQQTAENMTWVFRIALDVTLSSWPYFGVSIVCYVVVYTIGFLLNVRQKRLHGGVNSPPWKLLLGGIVAFLLSYTLKRIIQIHIPDMTSPASRIAFISINLYTLILDLLLLALLTYFNITDTLTINEKVLQELLRQEQRNYASVVENLDNINIKCHDMKHQLRLMMQLEASPERDLYISRLQHDMDIYEHTPKTGNVALDATLADKSIYCAENQIEFTCTVNPAGLDQIEATDIYALIGNAMDNAIECVMKYTPDKRLISLRIDSSDSYVKIQVENYCEDAPEIQQGRIHTSKADEVHHGFGLRSMESIATKYQGYMNISFEGSLFYLDILLLPDPSVEKEARA